MVTDVSANDIITEISYLLGPKAFKRLKAVLNKNLMEECEYFLNEPKGAIKTVIH
jgi:hypothetical protein